MDDPARQAVAPPALLAWIGPTRWRLALQFLRFGVVGVAGFLVDAGVLTLAVGLGAGPWLGRVLSYLAAASATYALNRAWTFRADAGRASAGQWALFLVVNLVGFAVNFGTYALLVLTVPLVAAQPVLGVAAGSLAGMVGNFLLSRRFVFRAQQAQASGTRYDGVR